jgi:hypothetical protein
MFFVKVVSLIIDDAGLQRAFMVSLHHLCCLWCALWPSPSTPAFRLRGVFDNILRVRFASRQHIYAARALLRFISTRQGSLRLEFG